MRTVMLIASIAMIASGIFCVANGGAAFLSVAFIIGCVLIILGICEVVIGRRADFERDENAIGLTRDGVILLIIGMVIISGQITDDFSAQTLFALYLTFEGVFSFKHDWLDVKHIAREQRVSMAISAAMIVLGTYMFFNTSVFSLQVVLLIGVGLIILGLRRVLQSFKIEYIRPSFVTGNEERLHEAEEEEKRALAKAKEGIREQKNAQRRIKKIKADIEAEKDLMMDAHLRKKEREEEARMNEE